ncbi:MAG: hypothetical protein KDB22_25415 [Planctomycetales bacterium]|nr:hypothetical protein [Planctomycetales bacterium]
MAINLKCPKCNAVLSVDDNLAGKKGKCKCGNAITIPIPKQKAVVATAGKNANSAKQSATASPSNLNEVFDDLTESDFNRQSPMRRVYSKQKAGGNELETLRKFEGEEAKKERAKAGVLNAPMISIALLCLLLGAGSLALAVMCGIGNSAVKQIEDYVIEAKFNKGLAVTFFSVSSTFLIVGGLGMFLKKSWGWALATISITFATLDRLITFGVLLMTEFTQTRFFVGMLPLMAIFLLTTFIYSEDNRRIFRVKSVTTVVIVAVIAIALVGTTFGLAAQQGLLSKQSPVASPSDGY